MRPPDALRRRTHLFGGQFIPPHQTRQDCRACLSTAAVTQARQKATPSPPPRPPTRSDVARHAKCKHAVDCFMRQNLFTKRHATRVIYRLTVHTLSQTVSRLNSHRLIRHRQDRLVLSGGRCDLGIYRRRGYYRHPGLVPGRMEWKTLVLVRGRCVSP